jgi:hypothetical protein
MSSRRYDTGIVQKIDSTGQFLRAKVILARAGVFPYLRSDGKIQFEAKLPEEITSSITIDTAKGAPVTDGHPSVGKVNPENAKQFIRGIILDDVKADKNNDDTVLSGNEIIYDKDLIQDVESGKKIEASIGFDCVLDHTPGIFNFPGEFNGRHYDAIQREIKINHSAHVERGRGGESVKAYLDTNIDFAVMQKGASLMDKIKYKLDSGKEFEIEPEVVADLKLKDDKIKNLESQVNDSKSKIDQLEKNILDLKKSVEKKDDTTSDKEKELQTKIDDLQKVIDELKKEKSENEKQDKIDSLVNDRIQILKVADSIFKDEDLQKLSNREIKLKVIDKHLPYDKEKKVDELKDYEVDSRYDATLQLLRESANSQDGNGNVSKKDAEEISKLKEERSKLHENKTE